MARGGADDRAFCAAMKGRTVRKVPLDCPAPTSEELRDIGLRQRSQDVRDLLYGRLRETVQRAHYMAELLYGNGGVMAKSWMEQLMGEPCIIEAPEEDYGSSMPGTRGWRWEVRTPEHEVKWAKMQAEARGRIAKRRARLDNRPSQHPRKRSPRQKQSNASS